MKSAQRKQVVSEALANLMDAEYFVNQTGKLTCIVQIWVCLPYRNVSVAEVKSALGSIGRGDPETKVYAVTVSPAVRSTEQHYAGAVVTLTMSMS